MSTATGKLVTNQLGTPTRDFHSIKQSTRSKDTRNIAGFKNHKLLPEPEIRELVRLYQETGNVNARNRVIEHNLKFIWIAVCSCVSPRNPEFVNVFNAVILDMDKAVARFDLARAERDNIKFMSYAVWWIKRGISAYFSQIAPMLRLPVSAVKALRAEKIAYLEETNPESKELASLRKRQLGRSTYDAASMLQETELNEDSALYSDSGDDNDNDSDDDTYPSGAVTIATAERASLVAGLIETLPERERYVIERSFAIGGICEHPMTLTDIAKSVTPQISKERVRQLRDQGYARIRKQLARQHIALHDIV